MSIVTEVNRVLVGDGINSSVITNLTGIAKGDLFLLNEAGVPVVTNAAAAALPRHEKVTIALGVGPGRAILSSPIQGNTVSKYEGKAFASPLERVITLGYNGAGSTGIVVVAGKEYRLRIRLKDNNMSNGQRPSLADYNASVPAGGTASLAVQKIATIFDAEEFDRSALKNIIKLERVSDGTRSALAGTATVTTDSRLVTINAHGLAVGTAIRLDTVAQTTSSPVYLVAEVVDANNILLDVSYKGITGTVIAANGGSLTTPTQWGLKLSALPVTELLPSYDEYSTVDFTAVFSEADNSAIDTVATTKTGSFSQGQGFWKQVRDNEEKAKGYLGDTAKTNFFNKRIASNVVEGVNYSSVNITHTAVFMGNFQATTNSPLKTTVYFPTASAQATASGDNFLHVLNGFLGTKVGFNTIASL